MSNPHCHIGPYKLTAHAQKIFNFVLPRIKSGGNLLDLGCGEIGHYWAMASVFKVSEVHCWDISPDAIEVTREFLDNVSPKRIETEYSDTITFLKQADLLETSVTSEAMAVQFLETPMNVQPYNFLTDTSDRKFDTVMSIEAVECVDSRADFCTALEAVRSLLRPSGTALLVMTPYDTLTPKIEDYINHGIEGRYNPKEHDIRECIKDVGLTIDECVLEKTGIDNYSTTYFIACHA